MVMNDVTTLYISRHLQKWKGSFFLSPWLTIFRHPLDLHTTKRNIMLFVSSSTSFCRVQQESPPGFFFCFCCLFRLCTSTSPRDCYLAAPNKGSPVPSYVHVFCIVTMYFGANFSKLQHYLCVGLTFASSSMLTNFRSCLRKKPLYCGFCTGKKSLNSGGSSSSEYKRSEK